MSTLQSPCVSIVVLTYNSAWHVIETLESVFNQSYTNIELIIADDSSKDDTVELCEAWLAEHKDRFTTVNLINSQTNTGIPANCERGVEASKGEWIKLIAGDDVLLPNCVSVFMKYAVKSSDSFLFCKLSVFGPSLQDEKFIWPIGDLTTNHKQQFINQLRGGFIKAPSVFLSRSKLESIGGFDLRFRNFEDDPLWVRYLLSGSVMKFVPEILVGYRVHDKSISNHQGTEVFKSSFFNDLIKFRETISIPLLREQKAWFSMLLLSTETYCIKRILTNYNFISGMTLRAKLELLLSRMCRRVLRLLNDRKYKI